MTPILIAAFAEGLARGAGEVVGGLTVLVLPVLLGVHIYRQFVRRI